MRREKCFVIITFMLTVILTVQSVGDGIHNQFNIEILNLHNIYREKHEAETLILDENMCLGALELATIYSNRDPITDLPSKGVNIYIFFNLYLYPHIEVTPEMVLTKWYQKGASCNYLTLTTMIAQTLKNPDRFITTYLMNFTQIVWKATKKIGVGKVTHNGLTVVVAIYDPPSNTLEIEDYEKNVKILK